MPSSSAYPLSEESLDSSLKTAREILGEHLLGPEALRAAFGFCPEAIPHIPFSKQELLRAQELDQELILQVDTLADGRPLTIRTMNEHFAGKASDGNQLLCVYGTDATGGMTSDIWYLDEPFANEQIRAGWKLTTRDLIPDSTSQNYLEQTDTLVAYLKDTVFKREALLAHYAHAIAEFETKRAEIAATMESDWRKACGILADLTLTELTRETPAEVLYRLALHERTT